MEPVKENRRECLSGQRLGERNGLPSELAAGGCDKSSAAKGLTLVRGECRNGNDTADAQSRNEKGGIAFHRIPPDFQNGIVYALVAGIGSSDGARNFASKP
jgi:hypothetical protein